MYQGTSRTRTVSLLLDYIPLVGWSIVRGQNQLRRIIRQTGFLDEDYDRDTIPDNGVARLTKALLSVLLGRPLLMVLLSYQSDVLPRNCNWILLPAKTALYAVITDFWFYWFHRLMHELPYLRKYHRVHHLSKRPNILLTMYLSASEVILDHFLVPSLTHASMTSMGVCTSFYELWVCNFHVLFVELAGHSGIRAYSSAPSILSPLLRWLGCDLIVEDHDLHHRLGWKNSGNYGKQTRIWDALFGTRKDRLECNGNNVDWEACIKWPFF